MPWHLEKIAGSKPARYFVVTTSTGRKHSTEGMPLSRAKKQLAALHIHADSKR